MDFREGLLTLVALELAAFASSLMQEAFLLLFVFFRAEVTFPPKNFLWHLKQRNEWVCDRSSNHSVSYISWRAQKVV
jgi:hypothetical protein